MRAWNKRPTQFSANAGTDRRNTSVQQRVLMGEGGCRWRAKLPANEPAAELGKIWGLEKGKVGRTVAAALLPASDVRYRQLCRRTIPIPDWRFK